MDSTITTRRPCFIEEEDDGLASIVDIEAGFSGSNNNQTNNTQIHQHFISRPLYYSRRPSFRNLSLPSNTCSRSSRFFDARFDEHEPHFLDSCFLCKKPLGGNKDIFMYRGDTPFCSEECRQEQIETDEAKEKKWNLKALRNKKNDQNKSTTSSTKKDYGFRTGAVAAA